MHCLPAHGVVVTSKIHTWILTIDGFVWGLPKHEPVFQPTFGKVYVTWQHAKHLFETPGEVGEKGKG